MGDGIDKNLSKPIVNNSWLWGVYYGNPWSTWKFPSIIAIIQSIPGWFRKPWFPSQQELDERIPVKHPDMDLLQSKCSGSNLRYTWLGHASCLIQMDGVTVLTDPVMSERCSFSQYLGPKRYRRNPLEIDQLPRIDAVVISHSHYDHLDLATVEKLHERFADELRWFVPMGLKSWFSECGIKNVTEMTWWQEEIMNTPSPVKFVSLPAQHWSNRSVHDRFRTLWGGWAIIGKQSRFYFAGDTGYCSAFREIGDKYGPFTAAAIPIGAYCPRVMMVGQHVDPAEAVKVHMDVKSQKSFGIHWGTFDLSAEPIFEPIEKLAEEARKAGLNPKKDFITVPIGEVQELTHENVTSRAESGDADSIATDT